MLPEWESIPTRLQIPEVRPYFELLRGKRFQLLIKRLFDLFVSMVLILLFSPIILVVSCLIYREDKGPVFFRQCRSTALGKEFKVIKFRTMKQEQQTKALQLTLQNDNRITFIGKKIRARRLDEIPQLFNIFLGEMSFVGTRPEVPYYVASYTPEMMATLLLPAGLTSEASIAFRNEDTIYADHPQLHPDEVYMKYILPKKMEYNLESLAHFSLWRDCKVLLETLRSVMFKHHVDR